MKKSKLKKGTKVIIKFGIHCGEIATIIKPHLEGHELYIIQLENGNIIEADYDFEEIVVYNKRSN